MFGVACLSLGADRVYLYLVDQNPPRFTSVLIAAFPLVVDFVAIRWGIRSIRTPYRL